MPQQNTIYLMEIWSVKQQPMAIKNKMYYRAIAILLVVIMFALSIYYPIPLKYSYIIWGFPLAFTVVYICVKEKFKRPTFIIGICAFIIIILLIRKYR